MLLGIFGKARSGDDDTGSLLFVLELADSFITYRSRYRLAPMLPLVLDLLLVDESNPRSIGFQLAALSRHIDTLPQSGEGSGRNEEQRMALSLLTQMRLADMAGTRPRSGPDGHASALQKLLAEQVDVAAAPFRRHRPPLLQSHREGRQVGRARSRADHDLRRQPSHDLRLPQARAAVRSISCT